MATERDFERLSVPFSLGSGLFCSTSTTTTTPSPGSHYNNNNTTTTNSNTNINTNSHTGLPNSDSGHHTGIDKDQLSVLARTASRNSQGSILSSSRRSVQSIHSHVSTFQNVRFEPDPIKDISFWGGMALLISNMTGPGLVTIPVVAQSAGWLPTVLGFSLVALLSTLSSLFICEAMTEVPGNEFFQSNVSVSCLSCAFPRHLESSYDISQMTKESRLTPNLSLHPSLHLSLAYRSSTPI